MGEIKKIGDVYYIEFYARGLLYSQVGGADIDTAQQLLASIEAKIAGGEALTIIRHIDIPDFLERFLIEIKNTQGKPSHHRFKSTSAHFQSYLDQNHPHIKQLASVTPVVVEGYKTSLCKELRPRIVNFTILLLREILEFGIKIGFLNDNPTLHVRLLPWENRSYKKTARYDTAKQLLTKGVPLGKAGHLINIVDPARMMYYANLISLNREEMYN